jgi:hypothetical protein
MKITTQETTTGLIVKFENDSDMIIENIASVIDYKVSSQSIEEIRNLLVTSCRFNEQPDIVTAKWFVENLLTDKEIRELIEQLRINKY